jgi:cytochrome c oxidase subunit II
MAKRVGVTLPLLALVLALAGCGGSNGQSTLSPHSHAASRIATLWWVMLAGSTVGFSVIAGLLLLGWIRRNRAQLPGGGGERAATALVIGLGIAVPVVVLTALFVWSDILVTRSTAAPKAGTTSLTVDVIGHQWFWEVRYPAAGVVTANELHIPVGRRVLVVGTTDDVIHSFWVPELNRKIDLIPGRVNSVLLDAERAGVYRGQCAEFCGLDHAEMSFVVVAEPPARFRAWLAAQARPARSPTTAEQTVGRSVFLTAGCGSCHTLRGAGAAGRVGPDLTHLGSRRTLAANTIPNSPAELRAWIADPQHVKPGNKMPDLGLSGSELDAVVAYLESLR